LGPENIIVQFNSKVSCSIVGSIHKKEVYTLDQIFDMNTDQETIFNDVAKETIDDVLNGYNGTIFTYGQSGSGKTYTMYGNDIYDEQSKGIIPRTM